MASILIIDDDDQFRSMLVKMLKRENYTIFSASDGKKGLLKFRENPTDLIITDLFMPEKEGIELIMDLKKEYPDIKVIAISGGGKIPAPLNLEIAKVLGAIETFTKPFKRQDLVNAIKRII